MWAKYQHIHHLSPILTMLGITIGSTKVNIAKEALKNTDNLKTNFTCDYALNKKVGHALQSISTRTPIVLNDTDPLYINSHYDVFLIQLVCDLIGIRKSYIEHAFEDWTKQPNWVKFDNNEYLYLIYKLDENAVDWRKFFREHPFPFISFLKARGMKEYRSNPENYFSMINFFQYFELNAIFDNSNDETQGTLIILEDQKNHILPYFLVNPHDVMFKDYFKYPGSRTTNDLWRCDKFSTPIELKSGDKMLANINEVMERLDKFTYGLLKKSPNPDIPSTEKFSWENICISGGAVRQIIEGNYNPRASSDLDIFVCGQTYQQNAKTYKYLRKWFDSPDTIFASRGSVVYVYITDIPRVIQIICINAKNPAEVIKKFDTSQIQWLMTDCTNFKHNTKFQQYEIDEGKSVSSIDIGYTGLCVFGSAFAASSLKTRIARIVNISTCSIKRTVKTLISGYHIQVDEEFTKNSFDIGQIAEGKNEAVADIVRECHTFFYPTSTGVTEKMNDSEKKCYLEGMIKLHSKADFVTENILDLDKNVVINGNFDSDYNALDFTRVQLQSIRFVGHYRTFETPVKNMYGIIRMISPYLTVSSINSTNEAFDIKFHIEDKKFIEFLRETIEKNVFRIYSAQEVTESLIQDDTINISINNYKLENLKRRGISILKDSNGQMLDINEHLRAGDKVRFIFGLTINVRPERRVILIIPNKFIKENNEAITTTDDTVNENNEEINAETSLDNVISDLKDTGIDFAEINIEL